MTGNSDKGAKHCTRAGGHLVDKAMDRQQKNGKMPTYSPSEIVLPHIGHSYRLLPVGRMDLLNTNLHKSCAEI